MTVSTTRALLTHYRYLLAPEGFQRLRVFAVQEGFFPYGDEQFETLVITKNKDGWMSVRVSTKPKESR
jgi:hypothetical protein